MKKLLALVLALVMTLSLAVVGSNAAYKDADKVNKTYAEAVDVLSGMGVFNGYTDGSFQPKGAITRAEVAAIVYRLYTGDVKDAQASLYATYNKFSDMDGAKWAAGYIGYCANAGLVKGYDAKTFGPADKVTGYQALAMILRAVGYDKNGEFTGADWQLHVAQYAQQLGVLKNVKNEDLNAPASRELVAELLFRTAAEVPMVTYSAALGYTNLTTLINGTKNDTLGYKNFKLVATEGTTDDFGRPSRTWNYNTGDKKTVVAQVADATYTVKVDECDIAKDLGISTSAKIESGWIDGYKYPTAANTAVTTDANGKIDAQNTTSYVGGQGRLTEVYDMGTAGYRIVEINTYLAQVSKVTAASTDKNGHTIAATIDVNVFTAVGTTNTVTKTPVLGVKAEGFTKDQYVLVTMYREKLTDNYKVASVEAATLTAVGAQTGYTAARGTVAATSSFSAAKYDNADKFFLNQFSTVSNDAKKNWSVATDSYGNAIGLVEGATNYLVIEAARFDRTAGSLYGGNVIADVVLADGSRVSGVTIAQVGNTTANHASAAGVLANGSFSDDIASNSAYYDHLFAYSVDANGNYIIAKAADATDKDCCSIYNKGTYIYNGASVEAAVNDATVFVVADKGGVDTYTYTTYVGKDNVPSMTGATICYIKTGAYASLVLVSKYDLASNTFDAYVAENTSTNRDWASGKYAFNVYKLGEETATTVYYDQSTLPLSYNGSSIALDGIYTFTVDSNNTVTGAELKISYSTVADDTSSKLVGQSGQTWSRVTVGSNDGTTLIQKDVPANTYYVTGTPTIVVTYDKAGNLVSVAKAADSTAALAGDTTFVGYRDRAVTSSITYQDADYLYVFKTVDNATGTDATTGTIVRTLNIVNKDTHAVLSTYTDTVTVAGGTEVTYTTAGMASVLGVSTTNLIPYGVSSVTVKPAAGETVYATLDAYYAG